MTINIPVLQICMSHYNLSSTSYHKYLNLCANSADDKLMMFLFFQEKGFNKFHANCIPWRQLAWNTVGFMAQSTQYGHIEHSQFPKSHVYWAGLVL